MSRLLKRLHLHGLIKKVGHAYKYYLTETGRRTVLTALKLRQLVIIPSLAATLPAQVEIMHNLQSISPVILIDHFHPTGEHWGMNPRIRGGGRVRDEWKELYSATSLPIGLAAGS